MQIYVMAILHKRTLGKHCIKHDINNDEYVAKLGSVVNTVDSNETELLSGLHPL